MVNRKGVGVWPEEGAVVVSAGPDYIRVTDGNGQVYRETVDRMWKLASLAEGPERQRRAISPWRFLQYEGIRTSVLSVAFHPDQGSVCQVSGDGADYEYVTGLSHVKPTRVDLQVTLRTSGCPDGYIRGLAEHMAEWNSFRERRTPVRLIESYGDGNTLYIGSRQSEQMLRVYNKGKELLSGEHTLRVEMEVKGVAAQQAFSLLADASLWAAHSMAVTAGRMGRFDVLPSWVHGETEVLHAARRERPGDARTWRWLRDSVRPAVRRLLEAGATEGDIEAVLFD